MYSEMHSRDQKFLISRKVGPNPILPSASQPMLLGDFGEGHCGKTDDFSDDKFKEHNSVNNIAILFFSLYLRQSTENISHVGNN